MYPNAGKICPKRLELAMQAKEFFMKCLNANIPFIAVENPLPLKVVGLPKETQVIQPYEYGHEYSKRTHLWLKGLPKLMPTNVVSGRENKIHKMSPSKDRWKNRSRTYSGIAQAMAEQWG